MKNLLFVGVVGVVIAVMVGTAIPANAQTVLDANGVALKDGDLISAAIQGDPDVFIIKILPHDQYVGYKRLFLNPAIFNMYGHLGGWASVHPVTTATRDLFETTTYFRNCESNSQQVWAVEVTGEDTGVLHHVNMSGAQAAMEDPHFFDKVFCINTREENFYTKSIHDYTSVSQIPKHYDRGETGIVLPTITNVTVTAPTTTVASWTATITGMLPSASAGSCYQVISPYFSIEGSNYLIILEAQLQQTTAACMTTFTQTIQLGSTSTMPGMHAIYVNGVHKTSYIVPTPTPTPTPTY